MRIARAGQYAIHALIDLASTGSGTVSDIAARTGVPEPFLHQLVAPLKNAGLVKAKRGPGGGLLLARSPSDITLLTVLEAIGLDEAISESEWTKFLPDPHRSRLENIERLLPDELGLLTLADLVPTVAAGTLTSSEENLADVLPPRRLLDFIGHQAVAVTGADRCALYFGAEGIGYVTTAVESRQDVALTLPDSDESLTSHWVPYRPVGAVAVAWVTGQQAVIDDTLVDPRASREIAERFRIRSVMATPIHAGQQGTGVLVLSKEEPNAWNPEDLERARELATIAGFAIIGHGQLTAPTEPPKTLIQLGGRP